MLLQSYNATTDLRCISPDDHQNLYSINVNTVMKPSD